MAEANEEKHAIERVCADLGLPAGGAFTQDWAYELGEEFRTAAYFDKYLAAYANPAYGRMERHVLVDLIFDITNELLQQDEDVGRAAWERALDAIRPHLDEHKEQVEYWAAVGNPLEDSFALSGFARQLLAP